MRLLVTLELLSLLALPAYGQVLPHSPLTGPASLTVTPGRITLTVVPVDNQPAAPYDVVRSDGRREINVWRQRPVNGLMWCPVQTLLVQATGAQTFDLDVSLFSAGNAGLHVQGDTVAFEYRGWYSITNVEIFDTKGKRVYPELAYDHCALLPSAKAFNAPEWPVACGGIPVKPPPRRRASRPPSGPVVDPCGITP